MTLETTHPAARLGTSRGIELRRFAASDLEAYREWLQPSQEWHLWNAPYSAKLTAADVEESCARIRAGIDDGTVATETPARRAVITASDDAWTILGFVSWHWEAEESDWRRIGATVFDPRLRGRGVGTEALRIWVDYLFAATSVVRLDFSTWSGNERMLGVGRRLGFVEEGRFRDAREVRGVRYDSVVMGVLRREWEAMPDHSTLD